MNVFVKLTVLSNFRHRSIRMSATVDARWAEEEQKAKPSLNMAILRVLGPQFRWGYIIGGIDGLLTTVARPLLLRELIDTIGRGTPASPQDSGRLMGLMIAILILEGWFVALEMRNLKHAAANSFNLFAK